ncbi:DNA (cytosine-5-)-methyltransferase [Agrococcus jenensis]|uniref:Cytosine-specific methyltransferase n=1 Tax=Agrococcus jenensis TaxID=46353 RepID=A0A3N2AQL9_9MICO|nr:DNA (cytosine-5-)-methyltransferase [Agrococcus jenensis]ROR65341.1 DNA (cytosine-5)-methyltransferase 1 [Agrococcus jenensis]
MSSFKFVDLFAGIGGFHAALGAVNGGTLAMASEIDAPAAAIYAQNWDEAPEGDIIPLTESRMAVPAHDVLSAGFPCQPFSKSGFQRGINEARGTLFFNILRILQERKPSVVMLENVRNLAGPRHRETWATIVRLMQDAGYKVSTTPTVFSPHLLPPELGGRPQIRDRVFIMATYVGDPARARALSPNVPLVPRGAIGGWNPDDWDIFKTPIGPDQRPLIQPDQEVVRLDDYRLTEADSYVIDVWADFVNRLRKKGVSKLPGFPIWADHFTHLEALEIGEDVPTWKADFLRKNSAFYSEHQDVIDAWLLAHGELRDLPASRRKLEWQAQSTAALRDTVMHLRPSGLRAKRATYLPALVAITQTSILGSRGRRISPREAARLQGLPDWFTFGGQRDALTYKQLGNGVNVGAAAFMLRTHVERDAKLIEETSPAVVNAILSAPRNPDEALSESDRFVRAA